MEDVAAVLNQVAGGLQQSFGTVFERVGQSLEQSAQMMQMMNAMMEAAMLQNLVVGYEVQPSIQGEDQGSAARFMFHVTVENGSQISIAELTVGVRVGGTADANVDDRALLLALGVKASDTMTFPLDQGMLGREGTIVLRVRSPGTQQWLLKEVPFRIPVLKMAHTEVVNSPLPVHDGLVHQYSDSVSVNLLREALGVSAFEALLTASVGYYRLHIPAGVFANEEIAFAVQIQQTTESLSGVRVVVVAPTATDTQQSQDWCRVLLEELESL